MEARDLIVFLLIGIWVMMLFIGLTSARPWLELGIPEGLQSPGRKNHRRFMLANLCSILLFADTIAFSLYTHTWRGIYLIILIAAWCIGFYILHAKDFKSAKSPDTTNPG